MKFCKQREKLLTLYEDNHSVYYSHISRNPYFDIISKFLHISTLPFQKKQGTSITNWTLISFYREYCMKTHLYIYGYRCKKHLSLCTIRFPFQTFYPIDKTKWNIPNNFIHPAYHRSFFYTNLSSPLSLLFPSYPFLPNPILIPNPKLSSSTNCPWTIAPSLP